MGGESTSRQGCGLLGKSRRGSRVWAFECRGSEVSAFFARAMYVRGPRRGKASPGLTGRSPAAGSPTVRASQTSAGPDFVGSRVSRSSPDRALVGTTRGMPTDVGTGTRETPRSRLQLVGAKPGDQQLPTFQLVNGPRRSITACSSLGTGMISAHVAIPAIGLTQAIGMGHRITVLAPRACHRLTTSSWSTSGRSSPCRLATWRSPRVDRLAPSRPTANAETVNGLSDVSRAPGQLMRHTAGPSGMGIGPPWVWAGPIPVCSAAIRNRLPWRCRRRPRSGP